MNINTDLIETCTTIASNLFTVILCIITGISIILIYKQLKTANINNFLEIENKVIQLKNELDILEKNEKIASSTSTYELMRKINNGSVNTNEIIFNELIFNELNENTKKEINEKCEDKLKNNYYCAVDTLANFLNKKIVDTSFQNKHRDTIIEIYNKINDNSDAEQKFPNIMKFGKKHKQYKIIKENKQ
ncbi:MAG: hypothetical protein IJU92_02560 [Spirochaetaceae bacterium]|nr:hypothetical protein [Spirochaetaceae bacterium]